MSNPSIQRLADESGAGKDKGNILGFIRNGQGADRQFNWFVPDKANGLPQAGLSRLNQSIEAIVYCILVHIVGGRYQPVKPGKRVQRYQLAVYKEKVRLDLTATPGAWLMSSHMAINTERTVAYNNKLRQAPNMNLWLNNDVNKETKE